MYIQVENDNKLRIFNKKFKKGPWLVFYFAPWCVYCKEFKPIWNDYKEEYKVNKKFNIALVNDTMIHSVKPKQNVYSYPTVKMYNNTNELGTFEGEKTKYNLKNFTESNLNKLLVNLKKNKNSKKKRQTFKLKRKKLTTRRPKRI